MFGTRNPLSGKSAVGGDDGLMVGDAEGELVGLTLGDCVGFFVGDTYKVCEELIHPAKCVRQ